MESTQFQEKARMLQDRVGPGIDQAKENLAELNERAVSFIKQNPGTCLLGALALGFIVGRIASR